MNSMSWQFYSLFQTNASNRWKSQRSSSVRARLYGSKAFRRDSLAISDRRCSLIRPPRSLRRGVPYSMLPCEFDGAFDDCFVRGAQDHHGASLTTPGTTCGFKRVRVFIKISLLVRSELHHATFSVTLSITPSNFKAILRKSSGFMLGVDYSPARRCR